jgi:hypothetical protein
MDDDPSAATPDPGSGVAASGRWARSGWVRALVGACGAIGAGVLLSEIVAFGFSMAGGSSGSVLATARVGALVFYALHHVPLVFDATLRPLAGVRSGHVAVSLSVAPVLGTLVVGGALFVAGRSLTRAANAPQHVPSASLGTAAVLAAGAHGAKVAVPYAALCGLGAALAHVTVSPSGTAQAVLLGPFTVGPAPVGAVLWPLLLAAVAGLAGGVSALGSWARPASSGRTGGFEVPASGEHPTGPFRGDTGAAVSGGGLMVAVALILSFACLLVLAAVDANATHAYFHGAFGRGTARGVAVVGLTALETPNMATWVLEPAMGSCVAVGRTGAGHVRAGTCVLSYGGLPNRGLLEIPRDLAGLVGSRPVSAGRPPPAGYLLFGLAPAVAVLVGGWYAARFAGAVGVGRSARRGLLAGLVFAAWSALFVELSRISLSIGGTGAASVGGSEALTIGPPFLRSVAVGVAWGVLGGAAGGALRALVVRRRGNPVRERVFPDGPPRERRST